MTTKTIDKKSISNDLAQKLLQAAAARAAEISTPMCIAIVDESANLKAFMRMDGAPLISVNIAVDKAKTVAKFPMPTHKLWDFIKDDPMLKVGISNTSGVSVLGGGFPIFLDGQLIGGIGISGGHYTQDIDCAEAALKLVGN